jgi:hypothetical protein
MVVALAMVMLVPAASAGGNDTSFVASLKGRSEVPPFDTNGQGTVHFKVAKDGSSMSYKLIVASLTDVVAAHIHCAPVGVNGPVGVTLFSDSPVTANGVLAQGEIVAPNLVNGCGWVDLDDVIDALASGNTYVNVHTLQILSGEIRGQVK